MYKCIRMKSDFLNRKWLQFILFVHRNEKSHNEMEKKVVMKQKKNLSKNIAQQSIFLRKAIPVVFAIL